MDNKETVKKKPVFSEDINTGNNRILILHNDDTNTFDFVIETLMEVCEHNTTQAEQCAWITHYNGKCEIKKGKFEILKPLKDELINRGLNVTID